MFPVPSPSFPVPCSEFYFPCSLFRVLPSLFPVPCSESYLVVDRERVEEGDDVFVEEGEARLAAVVGDDAVVTTEVPRRDALHLHLQFVCQPAPSLTPAHSHTAGRASKNNDIILSENVRYFGSQPVSTYTHTPGQHSHQGARPFTCFHVAHSVYLLVGVQLLKQPIVDEKICHRS